MSDLMTITTLDLTLLDTIPLQRGAHESIAEGACAMEWVSYLAHEPWSDAPQCVSPAIAAFCRSWNDTLNATDRNRLLKPVLPMTVGTRTTPEDEETRAWLATDWLCRVQTPARRPHRPCEQNGKRARSWLHGTTARW